jgi:sulfur carrier protein
MVASDNGTAGRARAVRHLLGWRCMPLKLVLNGQLRDFTTLTESSSLDELVAVLGLQGDRVAVEHNGAIVPRLSWSGTVLTTGDRLEVVHFVGGGSH